MNPADANPSGNVHGGTIMKLVDTAAGVCAMRHCRRRVVTAWMDSMSFLHPVYVGDLVTVYASVNDGHDLARDRGQVVAENVRSGEQRHTSTAYPFSLLSTTRRLAGVPPLLVESEEEKRRQAHAKIRRESRRARQEAIKKHMDPGVGPEV